MYRRILMPIDGSPCSEQAVAEGLALAVRLQASVTFLYVVEDPYAYLPTDAPAYGDIRADMQRAGEELLAELQRRAQSEGVNAEGKLVSGALIHPVQAILEAEADHELTVMATHGRRGFDRLVLGSVTEGVFRRATKPCLVIRCVRDDDGDRTGS